MLKPWSDSIRQTPSMTKLPPPIRAARRRSPCRGGARAGSPRRVSRRPTHCCNRRFRLGRGRRNSQPSAPTRASRRLSSPAPASLCSIRLFALDPPFAGALRQRLALARRHRLRRAGAPSRGFFRAARRRASFAQRRRERAHQPRRAHPSAVARFRRASGRGSTQPSCATAADLLELPRGPRSSRRWPRRCGVSFKAKKILWRRRRAPVRRRRECWTARHARKPEILALWLSDLMLARKLGWDAPIALLATTIARPSSRSAGRAAAPGRRRLAAPLRHGRRARRAGGSWARRRSFSAIGEAVERRAKAEGERGGAGDRNAARRRRGFSGDRGESREAVGSRQPASIRSAGRARRRARIVGAAQFSALRLIGISDEPSQKT